MQSFLACLVPSLETVVTVETTIDIDVGDASGGGINDHLKILGQAGSLGRLHHFDGPVEIQLQFLSKVLWIHVLFGLEIPRLFKSRQELSVIVVIVRALEEYVLCGIQFNGHDNDLALITRVDLALFYPVNAPFLEFFPAKFIEFFHAKAPHFLEVYFPPSEPYVS